MNNSLKHFKMKTPADMLAVHYFASSGQLKGRFIQEVDPPWTIWWQPLEQQSLLGKIGTMIKGELPQPDSVWEAGTPNGECKDISWLDLFRKAVIKQEDSKKVASEVILVTPDKEIFYNTVKQHFMLQQGQLDFAVFESDKPYYLLKIKNPSLWVFNTITSNDWIWYNLVPGQSGIYIETGWYIHDISGDSCFNHFQITDQGVLLIQKDGRLLTLKPRWKKGETIIRVDFSGPEIQQKEDLEILSVKPVLRKVDKKILPTLWKIEDLNRFKAILINESLQRFKNFQAVICKNNLMWVHGRGRHADRGLASILTDTFAAFSEIAQNVFVPTGKMLAPRLSSERFHEIFKGQSSDFIIVEDDNAKLQPYIIAAEDMAPVEEFVTLQAEAAAKKAQALKPTWSFEFKEVKKKKEVVEVEIKASTFERLQATSEEGQVGSASQGGQIKRKKKSKINLQEVPKVGNSDLNALKLELEQIDRQLLQNVADRRLWENRAETCRRMRLKVSAIASLLLAAVLAKDNQLISEYIFEYAAMRPEFSALNRENLSEIDKGRLLADMRKESVSCEFSYGLMLAYAARFDDREIFEQAISAMKNSFPGEKRQFYGFNEIRVASGGGINVENRVELLTENELPRINTNVKKFLLQVGCGPNFQCINIVQKQLHRILSFHLSKRSADRLVYNIDSRDSANNSYSNHTDYDRHDDSFFSYFWRQIDKWPNNLEDQNMKAAVARWLRLLVMDKIKETPLRDFFTGDLYKPPFQFIREQENKKLGLCSIRWLNNLSEDQFPPISDGRPIARAIYYRFSDNDADWDDYFKLAMRSNDSEAVAKTQRLLLLIISEFGPHPAFAKYIMPATINPARQETYDIYDLTKYCDMFRLCLAYRKPIDEQRLFNMLINRIPQPPDGWNDFKNSAEWIILCLLLTSSPARRFQLDNLIGRAMRWLNEAIKANNKTMFAEALTIFSFLSIGILADLVPEKLELHQLVEKRKVIWMEHAFGLASRGRSAFTKWQQDCGF
jgi:hypothetical protein